MGVIRILQQAVASQIAAGEIIDRPASVLRELMDNSLDAGADRIEARIEKGGRDLVRVRDNGVGMSRDDLLLSIERHATSKIEKAEDLFLVKTLGFRGEALPSIAAVSRTEITSRPSDSVIGYRLKMEGGHILAIEETGAPAGTLVEVRNLFYNLPARRSFLKPARTETLHAVDRFSRLALPWVNASFVLEEGGKGLIRFGAADNITTRLASVMGGAVAQSLVEEQAEADGVDLTLYLAPGEWGRTRADHILVYVNGRNVRDRMVIRALVEGYGQRLMKGLYPQAAVFLTLDPSQVDVNIHPSKQEVRFHGTDLLFRMIRSRTEKAMGKSHPMPPLRVAGEGERGDGEIPFPLSVAEPWVLYGERSRGDEVSVLEARNEGAEGALRIIGQLAHTYILCQVSDGLLIVDQHAAHERILYETLKSALQDFRIESQALLLPMTLELGSTEARLALEKREDLSRLGIEVDFFGGHTFLLRSVPTLLKNVNWEGFLSELLMELSEEDPRGTHLPDRALTVMACHGAVRAGDGLRQEEMLNLVRELEKASLPTHCPHGRPVFRRITFHEMEKMFKRVL